MLRNRNTKIIATLGPASSNNDTIQRLFELGADLFRLNFSHGTHATHQQNIQTIRKISASIGKPIGIIADLQGPKLRVGQFLNNKTSITAGQRFVFDQNNEPGNSSRVELPHPEIFNAIHQGDELLVDDGKLAFRVDSVTHHTIQCTALVSGSLSNNKGVNLPNTTLPIDILTEKDYHDLEFALKMQVDFVALSFVQNAEEITRARTHIGNTAKIIAKIEKPQAIDNLDAILDATDAVMIARGDLGVELPPEKVPALQRKILIQAQRHHTPVIVATQMLESMVTNPTPTRAEVSDVATAVYLRTDAVMLSAESASGQYPHEAVSIMDRILFNTENNSLNTQEAPSAAYNQSIAQSAVMLSTHLHAKCIMVLTNSFSTCALIASARSSAPIITVTSDPSLYNQLQLMYGVIPIYINALPKSADQATLSTLLEKAGVPMRAGNLVVVASQLNPTQPDFQHLQTLTF